MPEYIPSTCINPECHGTGTVDGDICPDCFGSGSVPIIGTHAKIFKRLHDQKIEIAAIKEEVGDILDKCNDIFEKVNE